MSTRRHSRPTARRRTPARRYTPYSLYRRRLRFEPLEDRRLLAVITVDWLSDTTDANDGLTTLREAIVATNLAAGADAIQFALSLTAGGPATIVLTQGELKITDSLTIEGPGAELLAIEASAGARIFNADDEQAVNQEFSMSGLTLTNSNTSAEGGAVYSRESLTLTDITVEKHKSAGAIRAVLADGAHAMISHSIVSENTGGGIWISTAATSVVSIEDTQIVNNSSTSSGGGVLLTGTSANVTIAGCVLRENSSTSFGGGIAFSGFGNLTVTHTRFIGNLAKSGGGGVHFRSTSATVNSALNISDSDMFDNEAAYGGGVSIEPQFLEITTNITRCQFRGNVANSNSGSEGGRGGGIHVTGRAQLYVGDSLIHDNEAKIGGGIYAGGSGALLIERCSVVNNVATSFGGGLSAGRVGTIRQSTFSGNSADTGGGISSGSLAIEFSTIANNVATGTGGGISFSGGVFSVDQSIIANNSGPSASKDIGSGTSAIVVANFSIVGDNAGSGLVESPLGEADWKGNLIGGPLHGPIDPHLRPLADYGGAMPTHALAPGSPAIDAGNPNAIAGVGGVPQYGQRGEPFGRVFNGRIDIGAFEFHQIPPTELIVDILDDESDANYAPGDLSLREALQLANLSPDANTIRFSPALFAAGPATLMLTLGAVEIVGSVTILGPGADLLTIDASGSDPTPGVADGQGSSVFIICDNLEDLFDAEISGLTLTGGDAQYGGAILTTENLTLTSCTITGNYAAQLGGGVAALYGTVRVVDCLISSNSTDGTGGGIAASSATLNIENTTISDHIAGAGGGIHAFDTDVAILNSDVSDNAAWGLGGAGGGIYHKGGALSVADSTISGNTSISGGGIYSDADATLTGVAMQYNYAYYHGGAVYSFGTLRIRETTITSNSAALDGGGIRARSDVQIDSSTLAQNEAGRRGGAAWVEIVGGPLVITDSMLGHNFATNEGGAVWVTGVETTARISHSIIDNNSTSLTFGFGGGVAVRNATLVVESSTVSDNTAATGGGFYAADAALSIIESRVEGNSADGYTSAGGGIYQTLGTLAVVRTTIADNSAKTGGGIFTDAQATIFDSTLSVNFAALNGGGIAVEAGNVEIVNSTLSRNSAAALGGAVWADGAASIRHSTIYENGSGLAGGGIFLVSGTLAPDHTIVARNLAPTGPDLTGLLGVSFSPRYSLIGSNAGSGLPPASAGAPDSNGNLIGGPVGSNIDPLLGLLAENGGATVTHALLPGSPAINAGDPTAEIGVNGVPSHDQRGQSFIRLYGGRIDMGAFEVQPNVLLGDYSFDGTVDAADFAVWRKTNGSATDLRADGNGDGKVDAADYTVWRANFGQSLSPPVDGGSGAVAIAADPTAAANMIGAAVAAVSPASKVPESKADRLLLLESAAVEHLSLSTKPKRGLARETQATKPAIQSNGGVLAWLSSVGVRSDGQNRPALSGDGNRPAPTHEAKLTNIRAAVLDEAFTNLSVQRPIERYLVRTSVK